MNNNTETHVAFYDFELLVNDGEKKSSLKKIKTYTYTYLQRSYNYTKGKKMSSRKLLISF